MKREMKFVKFQGCGNDFLIFDETRGRKTPDRARSVLARLLTDRHFQIGADGLMFLETAAWFRLLHETVRACWAVPCSASPWSLPGTAVRGPPVSVIYPQAGQGLAKVRVFTDFTIQLLRQWQRRVAAVTGLMDPP